MAAPGPSPTSASLAQSRLQGHLGHLTPQEEAALVAFKSLCAEQGLYHPPNGLVKASHDDGTLVYVE